MMTLIIGGKQKAQSLLEARWWIADCAWENEPEQLKELTDDEVIKVVDRHYYGGWKQFGRDIDSGFIGD